MTKAFLLSLLCLCAISNARARNCYPDHRSLPQYKSAKNFLAFPNFGFRGIGRCRGHAIVTQHLAMLADFRPERPHPCQGLNSSGCAETLYDLITEVLGGEVREIGGFDSLYEFSRDPEARRILRMKVASISHRYSAGESPLAAYPFASKNLNVFYDLIRRIKLRHRPYVGIQGKYLIGPHAVLAYATRLLEHRGLVVCARDPNVLIETLPFEDCQNYFFVQEDAVHYHQHPTHDEELFSLSLMTDEDERTEVYLDQRYQHCQRQELQ